MGEHQAFNEIAEVVDFAIDLQQSIAAVRADNQVDFKDLAVLPSLFWSGKKAFTGLKGITKIDIRAVMPQLVERLREKFQLTDHELELLIEDSVNALFQLFAVGHRWTNYFANRKAALAAE